MKILVIKCPLYIQLVLHLVKIEWHTAVFPLSADIHDDLNVKGGESVITGFYNHLLGIRTPKISSYFKNLLYHSQGT